MADKTEKFIQSEEGGVTKVKVQEDLTKSPALSDDQAVEIAKLLIELEEEMTKPQDFEWAIEKGRSVCVCACVCTCVHMCACVCACMWCMHTCMCVWGGVAYPHEYI